MSENCQNCGTQVVTMAFKGTGVCSLACQKSVYGDTHLSTMLATRLKAELDRLDKLSNMYNDTFQAEAYGVGMRYVIDELRDLIK